MFCFFEITSKQQKSVIFTLNDISASTGSFQIVFSLIRRKSEKKNLIMQKFSEYSGADGTLFALGNYVICMSKDNIRDDFYRYIRLTGGMMNDKNKFNNKYVSLLCKNKRLILVVQLEKKLKGINQC